LRRTLAIPSGSPLIVYLGLLAAYQGTDLLLLAMRQLLDAFRTTPKPHLLVMGFPSVARYQQRAAELGLSDHVTFTGKIAFEEAPQYLRLGDLAIAPKLSATEGSGKLLNYMATALPIVAFDTPVHREYLGSLGIYAEPGNSAQLASAMAAVLDSPSDAARRGAALRQLAVERYSWGRARTTIEATYDHLLRKGS